MDDGVDLSSQFLFSHPEMPDSFDDFMNDTTTCTHTHTCNPPGPLAAMHTHTCLHTHTHQVFATGSGDEDAKEDSTKLRKPAGNREAVRKYREKKKAHTAFLEEEVKKLRATNQQLMRRLQGHATLEAEVVRLRSILFDIRAKVDAEIGGAFPFQKQCSVGSMVCTNPSQCFDGNCEVGVWEEESSGPVLADCRIDNEDGSRSQEIGISEAVQSMDAADICLPG